MDCMDKLHKISNHLCMVVAMFSAIEANEDNISRYNLFIENFEDCKKEIFAIKALLPD